MNQINNKKKIERLIYRLFRKNFMFFSFGLMEKKKTVANRATALFIHKTKFTADTHNTHENISARHIYIYIYLICGHFCVWLPLCVPPLDFILFSVYIRIHLYCIFRSVYNLSTSFLNEWNNWAFCNVKWVDTVAPNWCEKTHIKMCVVYQQSSACKHTYTMYNNFNDNFLDFLIIWLPQNHSGMIWCGDRLSKFTFSAFHCTFVSYAGAGQ